MEDLLERARQLGRAMRDHPRFEAYVEASEALHDDAAAAEVMKAYNEAASKLAEKERSGQPIEVEEKRELEKRREAVASNPTVKAFMQAQANYTELMRNVNDAIYSQLVPPGQEAGGGGGEAPPGGAAAGGPDRTPGAGPSGGIVTPS